MSLLRANSKTTNRTRLYSHFNYAFRNYYSNDFNYTPAPTTGPDWNSNIYFYSETPGNARVDWGDGNIETYAFVQSDTGYYVLSFRSLAIDYRKDPGDPNWGLGKDPAGDYITPYPNHHYTDDAMADRVITLTFSNQVTHFNSQTLKMNGFPLLETPEMQQLAISYAEGIAEIPVNRIVRLKKLRVLRLIALGSALQYLPDALFDMPELDTLELDGTANLSDNDASNIRSVSRAQKLVYLSLRSCLLTNYIKEFNDLPVIKTLRMGDGGNSQLTPQFPEVPTINPSLTYFGWIMGLDGTAGGRTNWGNLQDRGMEKIGTLGATYANDLPLDFPAYIYQMRGMSVFNFTASARTQQRTDDFINNLYAFIMAWPQITMGATAVDSGRNQFYGLQVSMYTALYPAWAFTPSGTYQPPTGFVEGSANGTPATPMEKIYVLEKNYNQRWTTKP